MPGLKQLTPNRHTKNTYATEVKKIGEIIQKNVIQTNKISIE